MLNELRQIVSRNYASLLKRDAAQIEQLMESPKQAGHGHLALPVFAWSKEAKLPPPKLAADLAAEMLKAKPPEIAAIEPVSGFINFTFEPKFVQGVLSRTVLGARGHIGHRDNGKGKKMVIDFASPNVAKPMHIGHLRASIIGQCIVNLGKAQGYNVVGLNHLGDWGVQFGKLAWAFQNWGSQPDYDFDKDPFNSLFKLYVRFHKEAEKDPTLEAEGSKTFKLLEDGDPKIFEIWKRFVSISLAEYQRIWDQLGIRHELVLGESFYNDKMKPVENDLQKKKLLVESDGAMVVRLDEDGMAPCLIRKSDGASLYATRDLASAIYRMEELKADLNLYVVGVDQTLHFRQVFKVLEKMGYPWVDKCHHISFGMYRLPGGKISSRKGDSVFLVDVLDEAVEMVKEIIAQKNPSLEGIPRVAQQVGHGAIIFNDLMNDRVKNVEFDWGRILNFEGDSGPYVQYCGVRCASLVRKYGKPIQKEINVVLDSPEEKELIRCLLSYQDTLSNSFRIFKPHILAGYLLDVCHRFNQFYTKCRVLGEKPEIEAARMTLVASVHAVLEEGLKILSIELPEAM